MTKKHLFLFFILQLNFNYSQVTKIFDFNDIISGKNPRCGLIYDGTFLYGTTRDGGLNNLGVIYKIKPDGSMFSKILDFDGTNKGSNPNSELFYDGEFLFGTTEYGGLHENGTIYKIKTDGSNFIKLYDFNDTISGKRPLSSLISDNNFLYGNTKKGGLNNEGTIYKIDKNGSNFIKLHDFTSIDSGGESKGSLLLIDNFLYGMNFTGGLNNFGTIYKINTNGNDFDKIFDFEGVSTGIYPFGKLINDDNFLYGFTSSGGNHLSGTIFKFNFFDNTYIKLYDLNGNIDGGNPYGSLVLVDNNLYGLTAFGGEFNFGTIFKINTSGNDFMKLHDFEGITTGANPNSYLLPVDNYLYSTASIGGANNNGTIFRVYQSLEINQIKYNSEFIIYPNPGNDILFLDENYNITDLEIFNNIGQKIDFLNITKNQKEINFGHLARGMYTIKLNDITGKTYINKICLM